MNAVQHLIVILLCSSLCANILHGASKEKQSMIAKEKALRVVLSISLDDMYARQTLTIHDDPLSFSATKILAHKIADNGFSLAESKAGNDFIRDCSDQQQRKRTLYEMRTALQANVKAEKKDKLKPKLSCSFDDMCVRSSLRFHKNPFSMTVTKTVARVLHDKFAFLSNEKIKQFWLEEDYKRAMKNLVIASLAPKGSTNPENRDDIQ